MPTWLTLGAMGATQDAAFDLRRKVMRVVFGVVVVVFVMGWAGERYLLLPVKG